MMNLPKPGQTVRIDWISPDANIGSSNFLEAWAQGQREFYVTDVTPNGTPRFRNAGVLNQDRYTNGDIRWRIVTRRVTPVQGDHVLVADLESDGMAHRVIEAFELACGCPRTHGDVAILWNAARHHPEGAIGWSSRGQRISWNQTPEPYRGRRLTPAEILGDGTTEADGTSKPTNLTLAPGAVLYAENGHQVLIHAKDDAGNQHQLGSLFIYTNDGLARPCDEKSGELPPRPEGPADGTSKPTNPKDAVGSTKLPLHLWPETATALGSLGLLDGMLKYGRLNWRPGGVRASIYVDACRRHLSAWFEGEDRDPDSGLPHLAHALACLAILTDAQAAGTLTDDRQYPGGYRQLIDSLTPYVEHLKMLHGDKAPKHYTLADRAPEEG